MSSTSSRSQPVRILVVEDDAELAWQLDENLAARGYQVEVVASGAEAVQRAAAVHPALAVVDVRTPGTTPIDVCRRLRSDVATATTAIVLLTDGTGPDDVGQFLAAGADDYLTKPFRPAELVTRAEVAMRRHRQRRAASPLTGLPGHFEVLAQLDRLVAEDPQRFALVHVDLDDLAGFNRRHGIPAGDDAISVTAELLLAAVERLGTTPRLLGHVGDDDFVVLCGPDEAETLAAEVVAGFGSAAGPDLEGGAFAPVRAGERIERVPRLSVSLGVATSAHHRFASSSEVMAVAAEMLLAAKARPGSAWYVDRRWAAAEGGHTWPPPRPHVPPDAAGAGRDYLSTSEVAAILHVSVRSVARWAADGRLPHVVTLGGHRRFPRAGIEHALQLL
jgi:excisionase family DNA binding protein